MTLKKYKGFTLIELMVAMTISLIVVAAVLTMYVTMSTSNIEYLKSVRLNNEMRSAVDRMARDIRRAGYYSAAATAVASGAYSNPFAGIGNAGAASVATPFNSSSIVFAYDNGASTSRGYQLNGNVVEYCNSNDCTNGPWQELTDSNLINIDNLNFAVSTYSSSAGVALMDVNIDVTGSLVSDSDISRTMEETITIRNEH
jgi:prepilin-type N-terminal cleavage/methylation domain-containing protein